MIVNAKIGEATHKIEWKASNARVGVKKFPIQESFNRIILQDCSAIDGGDA
jgi:hypothetical protein